MKKISLILLLFCISFSMFSQKDYTINGETYQLKTEVEGTINLLWNTIDGKYRYFLEKDTKIVELTNTKDNNNSYKQEYLDTLISFTNSTNADTKNVKLTLPSLKNYINNYNSSLDSNYTYAKNNLKVNTRLGFFGGLTNNPFIENPDNKITPILGAELELYDDNLAKRHAAFLQFSHVLESDELDYSTTEIALGYRFRFINTDKFNLHANLKLATLSFSNSSYVVGEGEDEEVKSKSATSFDAPVIFGLGADFKVSGNGFITFYYNELFAVSLDNQGNFSTNFALGYKFNL